MSLLYWVVAGPPGCLQALLGVVTYLMCTSEAEHGFALNTNSLVSKLCRESACRKCPALARGVLLNQLRPMPEALVEHAERCGTSPGPPYNNASQPLNCEVGHWLNSSILRPSMG